MVADFTGRHQQVAALLALLERDAGPRWRGRAAQRDGDGGHQRLGRCRQTALAVHTAHLLGERFPDGHLFVNLRGYDLAGPLEPARALAGLLYGLGVAPEQIPVEVEAAAGLCRTLLADRRVLVLLDNARSAEQVRPLLPASPGSLVLVTSRTGSQDWPPATAPAASPWACSLPPKRPSCWRGCWAPTGSRPSPTRPPSWPARAFLPLALRIAAANLADQPGRRIAEYTSELRAATGWRSWRSTATVTAPSRPPSTSLIRALPPMHAGCSGSRLLPGQDVTAEAAAALAHLAPEHARVLLGRLAAAHLVDQHAPSRFSSTTCCASTPPSVPARWIVRRTGRRRPPAARLVPGHHERRGAVGISGQGAPPGAGG